MENMMNDIFNNIFKEYSFVIELKNNTTLKEFQTICYNLEENFKIKPLPMKNLIGLDIKNKITLTELIDILSNHSIELNNFIILGEKFTEKL